MALALALAGGAFWLGAGAGGALGLTPSVAHAQGDSANVSVRQGSISGVSTGEVLINGTVVIRMRTAAGGFSAYERATIIGDRIRRWVDGPYSPWDLAVRRGAYGDAELRAAGNLIVTVNQTEAAALGSTTNGLAEAWRSNIMMALGVAREQITPSTPVAGGSAGGSTSEVAAWTPSEPYSDKIVPILSVGGSTAIGAARINGPRSRVDQVVACTQLEMTFQRVLEIDVYVPVTTRGGLDRVQQVGVTALLDIEI